jgi:hypothetical protein
MSTLFKLHQVNVWQEEVRKTQDVCSLHKEFYGQKYVLTMSGGFSFLCVFSRLDELNTTRATFKERARELEEEIVVLRSRTNSTQQVSFWTNYLCSCGKDLIQQVLLTLLYCTKGLGFSKPLITLQSFPAGKPIRAICPLAHSAENLIRGTPIPIHEGF